MVEAAEQNGDKGAVLVKHCFVAQLDQVGVVGPARDRQDENDRQTLGRTNTGVTKSAHGSRTHDGEGCFGLIESQSKQSCSFDNEVSTSLLFFSR